MNVIRKKVRCLINIILIFITLVFLWNSYSFADISDDADSFIEAGSSGAPSGADTTAMKTTISDVAGVLTGIGIIVAVIAAAVLGIQFILGSTEQQAKIKESIIPYVCGCAVIFGALTIWKIIIEILNKTV